MAREIYNGTYKATFHFLNKDKKARWKKDIDYRWFVDTEKYAESEPFHAGECYCSEHHRKVLILADKKNIPVLVHECLHACLFIMDLRGIKTHNVDAGEPLAYLLEWLVKEITEG